MYRNKILLVNHLKNHLTVYVFMVVLFLTGIIFGAVLVNSMGFVQKQDLFFHLDHYFELTNNKDAVLSKDILKKSFLFHVKYLILLFILGLTIIGLPAIWILIFSKGLVIGFSVGFIVNQLGWKGLLLAATSIAPQNLIIIPVYLFAASIAMVFSLSLFANLLGHRKQAIGKPMLQYAFIFILLHVGALGSSLVETFISNEALKAMLQSGIYFIMNIN